jgi:hypothetical protein
MVTDNQAKQLHDRATRGEALSEEEKSILADWYTLQDRAESETLGLTNDENTLAPLKAQIEAALTQLSTLTHRLQEISSENEILRQENALLRRQLANSAPIQKAA